MKPISKYITTAFIILTVGVLPEDNLIQSLKTGNLISPAEARIGRPATPVSYAGVARRTTRRHIRRSTVYINTLPASCRVVSIDGTRLWLCGSTYYQSYNSQYVVVYVD